MANENNVNKDVATSLSRITDTAHKGTNVALDTVNEINKWYVNELNKIANSEEFSTRLETNVDNSLENEENIEVPKYTKLETKVDDYDELQTINSNKIGVKKVGKLKTQSNNVLDVEGDFEETDETEEIISDIASKKTNNTPKRIASVIKGAKFINNSANRIIKTGKTISAGMNENGVQTFQKSSSRIMTKPIKKVASKVNKKVTKKATNILVKKGSKVAVKTGTKIAKESTKLMIKIMQLLVKLIANVMKMLMSMLPEIAPVIIIIVVIAAFCSFFGMGMSDDTKKQYEQYMIGIQEEYDKPTVAFYNQGKVVDGAIEGRGMINWRAPLSILQMLNGDLTFDIAELRILQEFKDAGLYEKVEDVTYTYQKEIGTDNNGNKIYQTVTDTKKVVTNPSLNDFLSWCNNNFDKINAYKSAKKLQADWNQKSFTQDEVEQITLLYKSNSFFDLFSSDFRDKYAYAFVSIGDEQLQAIYDEFLKNVGKRYLMDHSNLSHDTCMDYYDCSSWVIHCLAHTGVATIPNTTASGIYKDYCNPVNVNDRQAGDLIFLKDTYDTGTPGGISHIGIYMGEFTINGDTSEWVIDTGGNPEGVKIRKYNNGWWNGEHFYGFGRLKENK